MTKRTKINWTSREYRLIAATILERDIPWVRGAYGRAIQKAMEIALPKERWRKTLFSSWGIVEEELKYLLQQRANQNPKTSAPEPPASGADSFPALAEALINTLAKRIAGELLQALPAVLAETTVDALARRNRDLANRVGPAFCAPLEPKAESPAIPRRPKILVVGPLPSQQILIERAMPHLDFRFVSSEDRDQQVDSKGANCDYCVVWTGFISHSTYLKAAKIFKGRINFAGSVDSTSKVLAEKFPAP